MEWKSKIVFILRHHVPGPKKYLVFKILRILKILRNLQESSRHNGVSLAGLQDKIDIKRLIVFTYNSNEQLKNKMRFTVAFKIASKIMKYRGINGIKCI